MPHTDNGLMTKSIEIWDIFRELGCIKLRGKKREFVLKQKEEFERTGSISRKELNKLRDIQSQYSIQIRELHEARQRARETKCRRVVGLSKDDVALIAFKREKEESVRRNDFGF